MVSMPNHLPKRGKEGEDFAKEGKRKARNDPLDYAKIQFFFSHRKYIHIGLLERKKF